MIKTTEQKSLQFTCIDLFAGAGGFSLAAQKAGLRVLAAVELDPHACNTYRKNFIYYKRKATRPTLYQRDIQQLSPSEIMNEQSLGKGDLDILMGGPPCQGFSSHRINNAGVDDPRNKLLLRYFDYVQELQPKIFIVENVSGLLWSKHKKYLNKFYRLGKKSGYKLYKPVVLDAKNYGIPQNRKRVFILGVRNDITLDIEWPPSKTHFNPNSKEVIVDGLSPWETARKIFETPISESDSNNIHMKPSIDMVKRYGHKIQLDLS